MKKAFIFLIFIYSITNLSGQIGSLNLKRPNWEAFKTGKLYVVLKNNKEYDSIIKFSVEKYWTFNKFEFINSAKFSLLQLDPSCFFLFPIQFSVSQDGKFYSGDLGNLPYLNITQGNPKGRLQYLPALAKILLPNKYDCGFMIPFSIKHLQWYCDIIYNNNITKKKDFNILVEQKLNMIRNKPLYVVNLDLNNQIKDEADIKKYHAGEVHVVDIVEFNKVINSDTDANFFLCSSLISDAWDFVYNIKTGELLYSYKNKVSAVWPAGIIPYHIKRWNR